MAKKKKKMAKPAVKMDSSNEVLTEQTRQDRKEAKKQIQKTKIAKKQIKADKPKRNYGKEIVSELKKVNWPSFAKTCKQTGAVLVVVGIFMLAILGIDSLVAWILKLLTNI